MKQRSRPRGFITHKIGRLFAPMYQSLYFPPAVILAAVLVATVFGWQSARQALTNDISSEAGLRADAAEQSLREHMVADEQILRGGAGLFQSSNEVTLNEWESFLNALNVSKGFSGVQSVGFVKVFSHQELPAVTGFMHAQGVKHFKITQVDPASGDYAAILYVHYLDEPQDPHYGYDMYADPALKKTMLAVRDGGEIGMTPLIRLLADSKGQRQLGFKIFAPYYQQGLPVATTAERRAALEGYVYASFRSAAFFKQVIGGANNDKTGFYVESPTDGGRVLYKSSTYAAVSRLAGAAQSVRQINLYGQVWTIHFVSDPAALVSDEQLARPGGVLFFGVFSGALVSFIVLLLIRARARELSAQKERAVELAKDELLSLASHQLRTPATGVKQYVGMVLQGFVGDISGAQRNLLERAYASNDRQLRIINEILHLAKIDAGRIVLAKQPTDLGELVSDIVNEQRPDIEAARHHIKVSLPKKPLVAYADTHMLRMAIENVLSNAIKYTHDGGHIVIAVEGNRLRAYISVEDTGIGINAGDIDKIFHQFSRLPNELSQQVGGTGIGLYLARHLVELHKGTIEVKSRPGHGSKFTIMLPLGLGAARAAAMRNLTVRP